MKLTLLISGLLLPFIPECGGTVSRMTDPSRIRYASGWFPGLEATYKTRPPLKIPVPLAFLA